MMNRLMQVGLLFALTSSAFAQKPTASAENAGLIFLKGKPAPRENFTVTVYVQTLVPDDKTFRCTVSNVTFEPTARTNWHSHQAGQLLLVTDGTGYTQERGGPIQVLHKGDVIQCKPSVEHWHGASPNRSMTHVAINPNTENGVVIWKKPVTDAEYRQKP